MANKINIPDYSKLFGEGYTPAYTYKELSYINDPVFGESKVPEGFKFLQDREGNNMLWADNLIINPKLSEPEKPKNEWYQSANFDQPDEDNGVIVTKNNTNNNKNKSVTSPKEFNKLLDEVSNEAGFEDLKDPEVRRLIILQAKRESNFEQKSRSSSSTASGYFQFIDSTRKEYSSYDKKSFLDNPKEQIRAAVKHLRDILDSTEAKKLLQNGYNKEQITALGWWYPKSMKMVLNGNKNFSLGGYSIKRALEDYE